MIRTIKHCITKRWIFSCLLVLGFCLTIGNTFIPTQLLAQGSNSKSTDVLFAEATGSGAKCADVPYGNLPTEKPENTKPESTESEAAKPPNPNGATTVNIGIYVEQITNIDESTNTFQMEGFLDLLWCDRSQAFKSDNPNVDKKIFLEDRAKARMESFWSPDIEFVNAAKPSEEENEEAIVYQDGTVEYRQKFLSTLVTNFKMKRFPFDTQVLLIELESFPWSNKDLKFHLEEGVVGFSTDFAIPGWKIQGIAEHIEEKKEPRDRNPFSEFLAEITVQRDPGFYVLKVIFPLGIITLLISAVTWLSPESLAERIGSTMTGLLTSAAYSITVSGYLPRHAYNTYLDTFILSSFVFAVLLMGESIVSNVLFNQGKKDLAERFDKVGRWAFPIGYTGILLILAIVYLI